MSLFTWLRKRTPIRSARGRAQYRFVAPSFRPHLQALEERWLPAQLNVNPVPLAAPVIAGLYSGPVDSFTETGRAGVQASDFQAVIDWGDHSPESAGTVLAQPDGSFEVVGGHTYHEGTYVPTVTITDTVSGIAARAYVQPSQSWTAGLAGMPTARGDLAAVGGPDGRIYALGGVASFPNFLSTVEAYDPATNTWSRRASMPTARDGLAAASGPDGRIYALGGEGADGIKLNTVEAYDPATNSWST